MGLGLFSDCLTDKEDELILKLRDAFDVVRRNSADILLGHEAEVTGMLGWDETEEEIRELFRKDGIREGLEMGKDKVSALFAVLLKAGRFDDAVRASEDKDYQERLMAQLLKE